MSVAAIAATASFNIGSELPARAREVPHRLALVEPRGRDRDGRTQHVHLTFAQLDQHVDRIAHGLQAAGIQRGDRVVVLVLPGIDLIALIFALFKLGAPPVFIDPGMGLKGFLNSVEQVQPKGLVTLPKAHFAMSLVGRRALTSITTRVRAGRGWLGWGLPRLRDLVAQAPATPFPCAETRADETAAILFTSGSTGPAKGVVYEHRMFGAQLRVLRDVYGLGPDDVDVPGLPVFALFSVALGATTVFPEIDYSAPAKLDPAAFAQAIEDFGATYSFGSPAIWGPVARHCVERGRGLPSMRRVFMAGAPVPPKIHEDLRRVLPDEGETFTPYGATESLPIATASGRELQGTFAQTHAGRGTCVGRPAPGIEVRVLPVDDGPIAAWDEARCLPAGEVGELVVHGDVVTRSYYDRPEATAKAKIPDGQGGVWHRMGDLGYLDDEGRVWFCGRKSHRVETAAGRLCTVPCEAIFNQLPGVRRSALVGVPALGSGTPGPGAAGAPAQQRPVLIVELEPGARLDRDALRALAQQHHHTQTIETFLVHPGFPVDVRHNAKIRREVLATWAARQLGA